jgi:hypothetical protein
MTQAVDEEAPADAPVETPAPRTVRPHVRNGDVVKVVTWDTRSNGGSQESLDTSDGVGLVFDSETNQSGYEPWIRIRVQTPDHGLLRGYVRDWDLVSTTKTPDVSVGDWVKVLVPHESGQYRNTSYYQPDSPYQVVEAYSPSIIYISTDDEASGLARLPIISWEKIEGPDLPEIKRPPTPFGAKIKALEVRPLSLMKNGHLGDLTGIVVGTPETDGGRIRAVFTSNEGKPDTKYVNSWEIVPFTDADEMMEAFQRATYFIAKRYGADHNLCQVLDKALDEMGLLPRRRFKVEFEVELGDFQGEPTLQDCTNRLGNIAYSAWPKGKITEVPSRLKAAKNKVNVS